MDEKDQQIAELTKQVGDLKQALATLIQATEDYQRVNDRALAALQKQIKSAK